MPEKHKRFVNKQKVEHGRERITKKRKIPAVKFQSQMICRCARDCSIHIDILRQENIFNTYWNYNWSSKTIFLRGSIDRVSTKEKFNPVIQIKKRKYTLKYSLTDSQGKKHRVCRHFFQKCLQVSSNRIHKALNTMEENPTAMEKRGARPSKKKISEDDTNFVRQYINRFPRYQSHYCREQTEKLYLPPYWNIRRMYKEYTLVCDIEHRNKVKEPIFRQIFNYEFNLSFQKRRKDTCIVCSSYDI